MLGNFLHKSHILFVHFYHVSALGFLTISFFSITLLALTFSTNNKLLYSSTYIKQFVGACVRP